MSEEDNKGEFVTTPTSKVYMADPEPEVNEETKPAKPRGLVSGDITKSMQEVLDSGLSKEAARQARHEQVIKQFHEPSGELRPYRIRTSLSKLGDLGVGIVLYLFMLLKMHRVLLICGAAAVPLMMFYYASGVNPEGGMVVQTSLGNVPEPSPVTGIVEVGTAVFLIFYFLRLGKWVDTKARSMSKKTISTSNYSLEIHNLPSSDPDAKELADYMSRWGEIAGVAIGSKNGKLIHAYNDKQETVDRQKKEIMRLASGKGWAWRRRRKIKALRKKIVKLDKRIEKLQSRPFRVVSAFVTFNDGDSMLDCYHEIRRRNLFLRIFRTLLPFCFSRPPKYRGRHLYATIAAEPSDVLWENIAFSKRHRTIRSLITTVVALGFIILGAIGLWAVALQKQALVSTGADPNSPGVILAQMMSSVAVVVINMILVTVMVNLSSFEHHRSLSDQENSLMIKIFTAQFVNTAITTLIIYGFNLDNDWYQQALPQIFSIMLADAFQAPLMQRLRIGDRIGRIRGRRKAVTQDELNKVYKAPDFKMAIRYASTMKTLVVALFFSSLMPAGLFLASIGLWLNFKVDKYLLLRVYKKPPQLDERMTKNIVKLLPYSVILKMLVSWWALGSSSDPNVSWPIFLCLGGSIAYLGPIRAYRKALAKLPCAKLPCFKLCSRTRAKVQDNTKGMRFLENAALQLYAPPETRYSFLDQSVLDKTVFSLRGPSRAASPTGRRASVSIR